MREKWMRENEARAKISTLKVLHLNSRFKEEEKKTDNQLQWQAPDDLQ